MWMYPELVPKLKYLLVRFITFIPSKLTNLINSELIHFVSTY